MVGFYNGGMAGSAALDQEGTEAIPSTLGQVSVATLGESVAQLPTLRLLREYGQQINDGDAVDDYGNPIDMGPKPVMLDADTANQKYQLPGMPSFKGQVSDQTASEIYQAHRAELMRQDVFNRSPGGLGSGAIGQTALSFIPQLMDPINLAVGMIPGVGESRIAAALGDFADAAAGRFVTRGLAGASSGAAGMAVLQPLDYLADQAENQDWSMAAALRNVAFGGLLGGGMHMAFGTVADAAGRVRKFASPQSKEAAAAIDGLSPEARENTMQGALGQMMDDRPVDAAPAIDYSQASDAILDLGMWQRQQARLQAESDAALQSSQVAPAPDMTGQISEASRRLQEIQSNIDGFRSDISAAQDRTLRAAMDPVTSERLAAVEDELQGVISAARRASLENERTMLLEGRNAGADIAQASGDREVASGQQEIAGLQAASAPIEAQAAKAAKRLADLQATDAAARAAVEQKTGEANARLQVQSARITSRESITQAMAERTIRRLAGGAKVDMAPAEVSALARRVLREGLDPKEAAAEVLGKKAPQDVASEGAQAPENTAPPSAGDEMSKLQDVQSTAADQMRGSATRVDPELEATTKATTEAATRSATGPSGDLAKLQQQIAELEQNLGKTPSGDVAESKVGAEPDAAAKQSQGRIAAFAQAAACLLRRGL